MYVCVYVCACVSMYMYVHVHPQGQKSRRIRVYNNNTAGSPEQCVNMDTMEMHFAIMAGFMHFSLAGSTGGELEIKVRDGERFSKENRRGATGRGIKKERVVEERRGTEARKKRTFIEERVKKTEE